MSSVATSHVLCCQSGGTAVVPAAGRQGGAIGRRGVRPSTGGGGVPLRREGLTAASPFPGPSIYFGSGMQTPLGVEETRGTGVGRRRLDTTELVKRWYKTSLTKVPRLGRVGHGGFPDVRRLWRAVCRVEHTQTAGSRPPESLHVPELWLREGRADRRPAEMLFSFAGLMGPG